jgi:hypothetical protein
MSSYLLSEARTSLNQLPSELHTAARDYVRLHRLPITLCRPDEKKPFPKDWPAQQWSLRDIDREFRECPTLNVGTRLGRDANVIDFDADSPGAERDMLDLFDGDVPIAPTWQSTRGRHWLFRWDKRLESIGRASIHVGALEVRLGANGKGAHTLLPPSVTGGHARRWGVPLAECSPSPLPNSILQRLLSGSYRDTHAIGPVPLCAPYLCISVADAIRLTVPSNHGRRNRAIFSFARHLKAIPSLANAGLEELRPHVHSWHAAALPFIGTKDFDETWADFVNAWPKVEYAAGGEPILAIYKAALADRPPTSATERYTSEPLRNLVLLCFKLQQVAGTHPFYLDCRTAGRLVGITHTLANSYLRLLMHDGVLKREEKGKQGRASRYRWTAD